MKVSIKANLEMKGLKDLKKRLKQLDRKEIEWGFLDGEHSTAGMSYAELATILEYGAMSSHGYQIPPRPAFTTLINNLEAHHQGYEYDLERAYREFVEGRTNSPQRILDESGEHLTIRYRDTMFDWVSDGTENPHNSDITIEMKGFDRPYVETGELIQNVKYDIKQ